MRIKGLVAAPFTPFTAQGKIHLAMIEKMAESLRVNKVHGAFVCGTTGEGVSMTVNERKRVAEQWQSCADKKLKIIVHVGHTSVGDSRALAAHAQKIGAAAIGCMAPYCFKPSKVEDLVAFCAEIAKAAPDTPFYYYHIPCVTGVKIPAAEFLKVAADCIPNLAGVKFTDENLMDFAECINFEGGRFDALFGRDEMLLAGLAMGASGAIGSTYNYLAPVFHKIMHAFNAGDLKAARLAQTQANAVIKVLIRYGGMPPAGKAFMKLIGLECGGCREPLRELSVIQFEELRQAATTAGFQQIACG